MLYIQGGARRSCHRKRVHLFTENRATSPRVLSRPVQSARSSTSIHPFPHSVQIHVSGTLNLQAVVLCHPHVTLDAWVVMPNHVHGIVVIIDAPAAGDESPPGDERSRSCRGEAILESPPAAGHDSESASSFISLGHTGIASPLRASSMSYDIRPVERKAIRRGGRPRAELVIVPKRGIMASDAIGLAIERHSGKRRTAAQSVTRSGA